MVENLNRLFRAGDSWADAGGLSRRESFQRKLSEERHQGWALPTPGPRAAWFWEPDCAPTHSRPPAGASKAREQCLVAHYCALSSV